MDSLQRAKRFLANKATKLALTAVPLAMATLATPHAQAGSFNLNSGSGCQVLAGNSGSCFASSLGTGGNATYNWIAVNGSGASQSNQFHLNAGGNISFDSGSGFAIGDVIPVSWDFTVTSIVLPGGPITPNNPQPPVTPTLVFSLDGSGNSFSATLPGTNYGSSFEYIGSGQIVIATSVTQSNWSVDLSVSSTFGAFTVNIPGGATLDLNSPASTPEPASLALTGAGLFSALLLRRRRKA